MATFTVHKIIDAYAIYSAEIEAATAEEAAKLARKDEDRLEWEFETTQEFDAREFVTLSDEGEPVEESRAGDFH